MRSPRIVSFNFPTARQAPTTKLSTTALAVKRPLKGKLASLRKASFLRFVKQARFVS
jgi:hypothetical protein